MLPEWRVADSFIRVVEGGGVGVSPTKGKFRGCAASRAGGEMTTDAIADVIKAHQQLCVCGSVAKRASETHDITRQVAENELL